MNYLIYIKAHENKLQQGDILDNVPYFELMDDIMQDIWIKELKSEIDPYDYKLPQPIGVKCILLSQNCDIRKGNKLIFAKIIEKTDFSINVRKRAKQINKIIRNETRTHYLPGSNHIDKLKHPHLIDFKEIFVVASDMIINNLDLFFIARLKLPAVKILQDKISRFFTRLAYDEEIFYTDEELISRINDNKFSINDVNKALTSVGRKTL